MVLRDEDHGLEIKIPVSHVLELLVIMLCGTVIQKYRDKMIQGVPFEKRKEILKKAVDTKAEGEKGGRNEM